MPATDAAPPVVGVTLAAVNGSRIYIKFSEPVTFAPGDITYATSTGLAPIRPQEAFLTVAPSLTALDVTTGQLAVTANTIHDAVGLPVAATTRPISQLMLDVVIPVWGGRRNSHGCSGIQVRRVEGVRRNREAPRP